MITEIRAGKKNLITDVTGIRVGNAEDSSVISGVTVIYPENPVTASCFCAGGGPGTRETDLLDPRATVNEINALTFSGGSAFGLQAGGAVADELKKSGEGFRINKDLAIPIVPGAVLFDFLNGGDKSRADGELYAALAKKALKNAGKDFNLGNAGAGLGAKAGNIKGGLGSASSVISTVKGTVTVGALAAVNSYGSVLFPGEPTFLSGWCSMPEDGLPAFKPESGQFSEKWIWEKSLDFFSENSSTTLCLIATDAALTKAECARVAQSAVAGLARAIRPVMTSMDGDIIFVISTNKVPFIGGAYELSILANYASDCLSRAIMRGVHCAGSIPKFESWKEKFGKADAK